MLLSQDICEVRKKVYLLITAWHLFINWRCVDRRIVRVDAGSPRIIRQDFKNDAEKQKFKIVQKNLVSWDQRGDLSMPEKLQIYKSTNTNINTNLKRKQIHISKVCQRHDLVRENI